MISAEVYVNHPSVALVPTVRELADAQLKVFSDAGTDPRHQIHFFTIEAPDFDAVESALASDPTVKSYSSLIEQEDRRTYGIEYSEEAITVSPAVTRASGLIVEARTERNGWLLELKLQDHQGLSELRDDVKEQGIDLEILGIEQLDETDDTPDIGLTEPQRKALVAAFVNGYYDEPREISLEELAELLDISPTAASGRLRRASATLVEEILIDD